MKRKLLSLLVALYMVSALLSAVLVFAEFEHTEGVYTYIVSNGEATITACDSLAYGDIVIPDTLGGYPVTEIGSQAFLFNKNLTGVAFPKGVVSIGHSAFFGCDGLKNVTFEQGLTLIDKYAFAHCYGLTSVVFPNSLKTIDAQAFWYCSGLKEIIIPNGVTMLGNEAFCDCSELTDVVLPDSIKTLSFAAFSRCDSLVNVRLPKHITILNNSVFSDCSSLVNIVIPSGVTRIGHDTFRNCSSLVDIVIPVSVAEVGMQSFLSCDSLTDVYFAGSEEEWKSISMDFGNESLLDANIHYDSIACVQIEKVAVNGTETIKVTTENIPTDSQIILSCYQGDKLSCLEPATKVAGQDAYYFIPAGDYTTAKVMVFENFDNLSPVIEPVFVE